MKKKMTNEKKIKLLAWVCSEVLSYDEYYGTDHHYDHHHLASFIKEKHRNIDLNKELDHQSHQQSEETKRKALFLSLPIPKRRRTTRIAIRSYRHHQLPPPLPLPLPGEETNIILKSSTPKRHRIVKFRRQIQHEPCKGGVIDGPDPPPPISEELSQIISTMTLPDHPQQSPLKLVIQRKLFQSDTQPNLNRLQMPLKQISSDDFLNDDEKNKINQKEGIKVRFIQPNLEEENDLTLTRWKYKGENSLCYVLNKNWYRGVVQKNRLKMGQIVQVWFFRDKDGSPCFAMVNLG
ncbi:hypothetical protein CsatB_016533 [Cannabis sativa]